MPSSDAVSYQTSERILKMSSHIRGLYGLASSFVLAGALAGCASYDKCGLEGCAGDARVTQNVQTLFDHHPELGPPNSIQVQTLNHVVYLNGMVGEGLQSSEAESVALGAPGVTRVVNSISVTH
jgi:osmotically-inducible protein OsmY